MTERNERARKCLAATDHEKTCPLGMDSWERAPFTAAELLEMECSCDREVRAMLSFASREAGLLAHDYEDQELEVHINAALADEPDDLVVIDPIGSAIALVVYEKLGFDMSRAESRLAARRALSPTPATPPTRDGEGEAAGQFAEYSTSDLAAQCRMQARDNLDPEYSRFMLEVADRLAALSTPIAARADGGEVLACPFCGGEALHPLINGAERPELWCTGCEVEMHPGKDGIPSAEEQWNTRAAQPANSSDREVETAVAVETPISPADLTKLKADYAIITHSDYADKHSWRAVFMAFRIYFSEDDCETMLCASRLTQNKWLSGAAFPRERTRRSLGGLLAEFMREAFPELEALQSPPANEGLVDHLAEQITFAEQRIQDGKEMGAVVWRIALEDIVRENRAALTTVRGPKA